MMITVMRTIIIMIIITGTIIVTAIRTPRPRS